MSAGELVAAAGVALALLANLAVAVYNYGRLGERVRELADRVSTIGTKVDGMGKQVARIEGRLGLPHIDDERGGRQ